MQNNSSNHVVINNRKARFQFEVISTFVAGIVLQGGEVKSIREGNANLQEGYAIIKNGEVWLHGMFIHPFKQATIDVPDPLRERKLLLQKSEIRKLYGKISEKGLTLIPLKIFFIKNHVKIELGLCRGKKLYDKREAIKERETKRNLKRVSILNK
ncbi:MAG: SsrA-binding protein SmpB [Bacteroidetes bacterium]|nr:SsrA-binding protein SmpB [Bacteroidota bacterium]